MKDFSIIISCGGTGGHFYPGLSIGREFKKQDAKVRLFVAGKHGESQKKVAATHEIEADTAKAIQFPTNKLLLPWFAIVFTWTCVKSFFYIMKYRPSAVLVMGSFASVPLGLAAVSTRTPLFLHEGNTVIGKANRLLSKWAKKLFLSFPALNDKQLKVKTDIVGMPIRPELVNYDAEESKETIKKCLGFDENLPLLLVFGGSQGAQRINENFYKSLPEIKGNFQLYHLSGKEENTEFEELAKTRGIKAKIQKSTENMSDALRAADLVICRAGASSLAELAWFKKTALFIPLKIAAENHQYHNAKLAEDIGGGMILTENDISPDKIGEIVSAWLCDPAAWLIKSKKIGELAKNDVAETVAKSIVESC